MPTRYAASFPSIKPPSSMCCANCAMRVCKRHAPSQVNTGPALADPVQYPHAAVEDNQNLAGCLKRVSQLPQRLRFQRPAGAVPDEHAHNAVARVGNIRSEEHTSELQSRVDISYAVFC